MDNRFQIPDDVQQAAKELAQGNFNLKVPPHAVTKNEHTRWTEYVTVEDAFVEAVTGSDGSPQDSFRVSMKILPVADDTNAGRSVTYFGRLFSYASGGSPSPNMEIASKITLKILNTLAMAAGFDVSAGISGVLPAMFPDKGQGTSQLVGMRLAITMHQDERVDKEYQGRKRQQVDAFQPAPEGI